MAVTASVCLTPLPDSTALETAPLTTEETLIRLGLSVLCDAAEFFDPVPGIHPGHHHGITTP